MSTCNPEKCLSKCAIIEGVNQLIEERNKETDELIIDSTSTGPETFARKYLNALGKDPDVSQAGVVARDILEIDSEIYGDLKRQIWELEEKRSALVAGCAGPLGLRAVRDGVEYVARVCTSPAMGTGISIEPVEVSRTRI